MTFSSHNQSREAGLEVSLKATKSLLADYALRTKQAEEMTALLVKDRVDMNEVAKLIATHFHERGADAALHYGALVEVTVTALNAAAQGDDETMRTLVNSVLRDLTMALSQRTGTKSTKKD